MKKNKFLKRFFAVAFSLLILSALLIPCFADLDYSSTLGGVYYLPVSEAGISYNTLLNSSGTYYRGDLPTDAPYNYSTMYRGSFITCDNDANYFVTHSFTDSSSFVSGSYTIDTADYDVGLFEITFESDTYPNNSLSDWTNFFEFLVNDGEGNYCSLLIASQPNRTLDITFYCYFRFYNDTLPSTMTDVLDSDVLECGVRITGGIGDWDVLNHAGFYLPLNWDDLNDRYFIAEIPLYSDGTLGGVSGRIETFDSRDDNYISYSVDVCTYIRDSSFNVIMASFMNVDFAPNQRYSCFVPNVIINPPDSPSEPPSGDSSDPNIIDMIFAMFQAPAVFLSSMLDFTIFGVNLYHVLKVVLTISLTGLIVGTVVKIVLHFKS